MWPRHSPSHLFLQTVLCAVPVYVIAGATVVKEYNFRLQLFCDVTAVAFDVISSSRSRIACSVTCAQNDACKASAYDKAVGCLLYSQDLTQERLCNDGENADVRAFVQVSPCQNGGSENADGSCSCIDGYVGDLCERLMEDCYEGVQSGHYTANQVYWINPSLAPEPRQVYCQMSQGVGLTMIQMHTLNTHHFNRSWQEYKDGFKQSTSDFWTGNDVIHWLTNSHPFTLIMTLQGQDSAVSRQRYFRNFVMASESEDYAVTFSDSYKTSGDMEDCWPDTSIRFSTYDRDNDGNALNCAAVHGVGFWFQSTDCTQCNPNGDIHLNALRERLGVPWEIYWTPNLGNWAPRASAMALLRL